MPRSQVCRARLFSGVGTLLSTSFDAGVLLRDVQEAASHADPRTTMRYDRARRVSWLSGGALCGW